MIYQIQQQIDSDHVQQIITYQVHESGVRYLNIDVEITQTNVIWKIWNHMMACIIMVVI